MTAISLPVFQPTTRSALSIARTFATRSCSWDIPERGSMPITIDIDLSDRPGVPAGWLFFIQYGDGAATVARKNHPSVFINGVTYA
ncbi:hypothetical protein [Janthinobacterium sp. SUN120]|uniref:hypothetical protein n=1 Tax=Janthinobacterium sp. SUN120 TaxID=3004099 RepID=UPI0025B0EC1E|nr:hypothetical protein [Janthinobacterium sp. SUN120]MDN2716364.1 hypothetical protein [Janthinobacterium sp. SUN120]